MFNKSISKTINDQLYTKTLQLKNNFTSKQLLDSVILDIENLKNPLSFNNYDQIILSIIAGETINSPRAIMIKNSQAFHFNPSDENNYHNFIGISNNSATKDSLVYIIKSGKLNSQNSFIQDSTYWVGNNGLLTTTIPTSGIQLEVGYAIDNNNLFVTFENPIITI